VYRIGLDSDLSQLPLPFFDRRDATELVLPFVFAERPSLASLEAASILASHWGKLSSYRGARFPVHLNQLPSGNAIVFATEGQLVGGLNPGRIEGPTVILMDNPSSPHGQLLLLLGRNASELATAARALALGEMLLTGKTSRVNEPQMTPRLPYDAPNWVSTNRPVSLGEIIDASQLEGHGISPGVLSVPFQTSPDIFVWGREGIPVTIRYRYPGSQWLDLEASRLDVLINDRYIDSIPLNESEGLSMAERFVGADYATNTARIKIPPFNLFGLNQLQFFYDLHPRLSDPCADALPAELRAAIDANTTIDLSGVHRYTKMPNLAFLAQAGFPFSRMADLSETAIVMPDQLGPAEIETVLNVMGVIGARTGYPATGITVVGSRDVAQVANRDLLVVGTYEQQPLYKTWDSYSPILVNGRSVRVELKPLARPLAASFLGFGESESSGDLLTLPTASTAGILSSFRSPLDPGRTVVALMGPSSDSLLRIADVLRSSEESPLVQGDLVVVTDSAIDSHEVADTYYIGELPAEVRVQWYLSERPWIVSLLLLVGVMLLSLSVFQLMKFRALRRGIEVTT
jgi:cellulose synthase (UDP-forming)